MVAERSDVRLGAGRADDGVPRLFVKAEHLQVSGSFKVRGAINRVAALSEPERRRGIITASNGNHAQAVAYAGAAVGVPVTVIMPVVASPTKVAAATGYGARVILYGQHFGEALAHAEALRYEHALTLIHAYDDPSVIAGQGTVALELLEDLPEVDLIVVGAGGGGLVSGVASAVKAIRRGCRIYAVEPVGSDGLRRAVEAGRLSLDHTRDHGRWARCRLGRRLDVAHRRQPLVDGFVVVSEATIARGVVFALERMKQLVRARRRRCHRCRDRRQHPNPGR